MFCVIKNGFRRNGEIYSTLLGFDRKKYFSHQNVHCRRNAPFCKKCNLHCTKFHDEPSAYLTFKRSNSYFLKIFLVPIFFLIRELWNTNLSNFLHYILVQKKLTWKNPLRNIKKCTYHLQWKPKLSKSFDEISGNCWIIKCTFFRRKVE